jgi:anti-anti-sigma regulatory factor
MVILDIAGVPAVDSAVSQALLRAIQAVRLLGCEVTVTGISVSVAATMTQLGIHMAGVHTARTPQEVISASLVIPTPHRV